MEPSYRPERANRPRHARLDEQPSAEVEKFLLVLGVCLIALGRRLSA